MELRKHAPEFVDAMIDLVRRGMRGELTNSDKILSTHLEFVWQAMFGRHPQSVLLAGGLDVGDAPGDPESGLTALLHRARLESEQRKLPKEIEAPPLTPAEREISPLQVMLAQVRDTTPDGRLPSSAQVLENIVGKDRAKELIGERAVLVDSTGAALAPPSVATKTASATETPPKATTPPPTPKPAPFNPDPPPPPKSKPQSASAKRAPPPGAPFMPGHAEFLSARATVERDNDLARMQEEARKDPVRYPGGQLPMSMLPPDPRSGPEVINFTRTRGGGIKRVS